MAKLGNVTIPAQSTASAFPLTPDYPYSYTVEPGVYIHTFGSIDAKIEQRYTAGDGLKRYVFRKARLTVAQRAAFESWWYLAGGPLSVFPFSRPNFDGSTTTVSCRFADSGLSFEAAAASITSLGITLIEVPTTGLTFGSVTTVLRAVTGSLATSLTAQVQTLIPLVEIQPSGWETALWGEPYLSAGASSGATSVAIAGAATGTIPSGSVFTLNDTQYTLTANSSISGGAATLIFTPGLAVPAITRTRLYPLYPVLLISDRLVTVAGAVYQPRLLEWDGIRQSITGGADQATFTFGNADQVFTTLANSVDLRRSEVRFSLLHANTSTVIQMWRGHITKYRVTAGPTFPITCLDGIYELTLPYPVRRITRTCQKMFNNAETGCPWASAGSGGDASSCDKGWDTANGCRSHGMDDYFGGIVASPQSVDIKDNSTGFLGYGRDHINSTSQVADSVYDQVMPEVYVSWVPQDGSSGTDVYANDPNDAEKGFPVNAKIIEGRKESDFYVALGIVGEGPLGFPSVRKSSYPGANDGCNYLLDSQPPHGISSNKDTDIYPAPATNPTAAWGCAGLRRGSGHDPVQAGDQDAGSALFALSQGGAGAQSYGSNPIKAAGTAFIEIRRQDTPGSQPSTAADHSMTVPVRLGLPGYAWPSGAGSRTSLGHITNPVWICLNAYLKGRGVWHASATIQERYFDAAKVSAAAAICDTTLARILGTGNATQFRFTGIIQEEKPLRVWLQEILNNCLGNFSFDFGRLVISLRINSSVTEAFTTGNVLFNSAALDPVEPQFNSLKINFADEEFAYKGNAVEIYNEPHALLMGGTQGTTGRPQYTKGTLNLAGVTTKDHAGRLASVRLCEELGGINAAQFAAARRVSFRTTALALNVSPGTVCSLSLPECPNYPAQLSTASGVTSPTAHFIEFRCNSWKLNKDFSIDIEGQSTNWDMYDVTVGPKPADVQADPVPSIEDGKPANWNFRVTSDQGGSFILDHFSCLEYYSAVTAGHFDIYYCPEASQTEMFTAAGFDDLATTIDYGTYGTLPVAGEWLQMESELLYINSVTPTDDFHGLLNVTRGALGTSALPHLVVSGTFVSHNPDWACEYTIADGLFIYPGWAIISGTDGSGENGVIAEYDRYSGLLRTTRPLTTPTDGSPYLLIPPMRRIVRLQHTVNFPPRFFASHANATFGEEISEPFAGIALVVGRLQTSFGLLSDELVIHPNSETLMSNEPGSSSEFPFCLRTGGSTRYTFTTSLIGSGAQVNVFDAVAVAESQPFDRVWAEIPNASPDGTGPLNVPPPAGEPIPGIPGYGGSITITHTCSGWEQVTLTIGSLSATWRADTQHFDSSNTTAQIASSMATIFQGSAMGNYYTFTASGSSVRITDSSRRGGAMAVTNTVASPYTGATGALTLSSSALAPVLGIIVGRRYAFAWKDATHSFLSELSAATRSTGPTGPNSSIALNGIPTSSDSRVTHVAIYAGRDGDSDTFTTWRLVATVSNGTTTYLDTATETTLAGHAAYPGPAQPTDTGHIVVKLTRNGYEWVQLRIPPGGSKSNVIHGFAMFNLSAGTQLDADTDNTTTGAPPLRIIAE